MIDCFFFKDMVNGFHQHFNVVEIVHYHDNGLLLMLYHFLDLMYLELIWNLSKIYFLEKLNFFSKESHS